MAKRPVEEALLAAGEPEAEEEILSVREELKKQLWLAGPMIAGALLQNVIQMISVMYVGHLGELPLAGASMANSFATVTGLSLLLGMASALDTLCGQAFGARQYYLLGIYKQRAMFLLTLVSLPLAVVWFYTGEILLLFGQDADIAAEAGTYARWMIPLLFAYGLLQCHVRFPRRPSVTRSASSGSLSRRLSWSAWKCGRLNSLCSSRAFFPTQHWRPLCCRSA